MGTMRQRNFSSRHVPSIAEEIAISDVLNPSRAARLNGLMKHLKRNSAWEDYQKQVLSAEAAETLVPMEYDEALRSEFARRCAFGERMNTEAMSSAKWVKLLRDINVILPPGLRAAASGGPPMLQAEADIIFHKVLHNCDRGGQRLTYELFCKALYLVAQAVLPDFQGEVAFGEVLAQIVAVADAIVAAAPPTSLGRHEDPMLDARVLLVLDHFKPALHDLFYTFCGRNLSNPALASPGSGIRRARERSGMMHTQDTVMTSSTLNRSSPSHSRSPSLPPAPFPEATNQGSPGLKAEGGSDCRPVLTYCKDGPPWDAVARDLTDVFSGDVTDVPGAGGLERSASFAGSASGFSASPPPAGSRSLRSSPRASSGVQFHLDGGAVSPTADRLNRSFAASSNGSPRSDTYQETANGSPVISNRRQNMSLDQFVDWCREFKMLPDVVSRIDIARIFKRAQTTGFSGSHGSGVHGYLSREAFVDAVGQLGLEAYSKEPFCDEYPEAHEKICAFLLDYLPGNSREARDRFIYAGGPRR